MDRGGWSAKGLSPFLSERARSRAPQVLSYAAVTGAAMLVSPAGDVVLFSGAAADVDVERIARIARSMGGADATTSFTYDTTCVHAAPVCTGWMLCVLSTAGVSPTHVVERLTRANAVLALALTDGGGAGRGGGGPAHGGAPAEAFAEHSRARKS